MNRKHLLLTVSASLLALQAQAAPLTDARSAARGGTGVALADLRSPTMNPASVAAAPDAGFAFNMGIGAFAADPDKAIDKVDDTQDDMDELEDKINNGYYTTGDENQLIGDLQDLSGKKIKAEVGGALVLSIPADRVKMAFFAKNHTRIASSFYYDPNDETYIRNAAMLGYLDTSGIMSSLNVSGVAVSDYGISLANTTQSPLGRLDFGTSVKYQQIILADKKMQVASYDNEDIFNTDNDTEQSASMNLDLGATQHLGESHWQVAAVAENLLPYKTTVNGTGNSFKMSPQLTVAGAYDIGWFKTEANLELLKNNGFGQVQDTQMLRFGAELGARKAAQLRVGYVHDLKGNQDDMFTAGIGLSPFDVLNIDIAAMAGPERTYGAMLGLGLKI